MMALYASWLASCSVLFERLLALPVRLSSHPAFLARPLALSVRLALMVAAELA